MIKRLIAAIILAALAALYGLGSSYQELMKPNQTLDRFAGIHPDSWMEDNAQVILPDLAPIGNRLTVSLKTWRPASAGPAHFRVFVCDEQRAEFVVDKDQEFTFGLKGSCAPRHIKFDVINPVVVSSTDKRELGAQLNSMVVGSRLGVPIVSFNMLVVVFAALLLLWFIYDNALNRYGLSWIALVLLPLAYPFLADLYNFQFARAEALWVLFCAFGAGIWIAEKFLRSRNGSLPDHSDDITPSLARILILAIVVFGAALRFYGIRFGFPNNYHPDEVPKVNAIMRMVDSGTLNPQYFLHPSLLLYSSYGLNKVFHFFGMEGAFRDTAFFAGRCVSAIAGTLSIYLTYRAGALMFSRLVGAASASLLAVYPLHVTCSRYMKEDALLLFFILFALVVMLKAVYEEKPRLLVLAGFLAGISASTKYSGLLTVLIVGGAPWLKSRSILPNWNYFFYACLGGAVAPIGFAVCTPYSLITPEKFIKDFNSEAHHMERGHTTSIDAWSQYWTFHYWRSVVPGVGMFSAVLAAVAAGAIIFRWYFPGLFIVGLLLMYYLPAEWVKAKPAPQPERYILPCLPFIALINCVLLDWLRRTRLRAVVPLAFCVLLAMPMVRSMQLASEVANDTRDQMAKWMIENLPQGTTVLLDWKPYCPRFWNNEFNIVYVPRATILTNLRLEALKKSEGQYLLLSSLFYERYFSQPNLDPGMREQFREVFTRVPIIKEIEPKYGTYGFNNPALTLFSLKKEDFDKLEAEIEEQRQGKREETFNDKFTAFRWRIKKFSGSK